MADLESQASDDPESAEDVSGINEEEAEVIGQSGEGEPEKSESALDRRSFLAASTVAIGGIITAGISIPAVAYVIGPALGEADEQNWIRLGSVSKVELGEPTLFKAIVTRRSGWIVNEEEISFYVLTDNGRDFIALSSICTHLGCRVRWITDQGQYLCPCHNALFGKEGEVITGPPPRPLDRLEVKVEDDQLFVLGG
ncbi:MAG: ubiquinol-cytochrome c reductase iron-sulfur subunit [Anaerolineales bacterium]|nr:ubiquinol-cytochrome c reductase iron-sulfur subunit [Anaerolineales bacterium]